MIDVAANTTVNTVRERWASLPEDQRKQNHTSLNYVQALAATTGTNIRRWNVLAAFGVGDGSDNLLADPRQLNKAFFDKLADVKPVLATDDEEMAKLVKTLRRTAARTAQRQLNDAQTRVTRSIQRADEYYRTYLNHLQDAATQRQRVEQLEADTTGSARADRVAKEITDALAGGFWCDPLVHNNVLWLRTSGNIVMSHRNPAANIDVRVDLGRFGVKLNLADSCVEVVVDSDNLNPLNSFHPHPHVHSGGAVCWGDAHEVVTRHFANGEFGAVLELLTGLLTTYCNNAPYVALEAYPGAPGYSYDEVPRNLRRPTSEPEQAESAAVDTSHLVFNTSSTVRFDTTAVDTL